VIPRIAFLGKLRDIMGKVCIVPRKNLDLSSVVFGIVTRTNVKHDTRFVYRRQFTLDLIHGLATKAPPGSVSIRQVAIAHRFRNLSPHLPRIWTGSSASQDLGSRVKPRPQEPSSRRTGPVYCVVWQQVGYQVIASSYALSI